MAEWWRNYILQRAPAYNVDPKAALAVARAEGLGGGVGDNGTSFGPFQLHVGGALPTGKNRAWAESKQGIDYALKQIGGVAGGLSGRPAVEAIVRKFERPADPDNEIEKATGFYKALGTIRARPGPSPTQPSAYGAPASQGHLDAQKGALLRYLAANNASFAATGRVDTSMSTGSLMQTMIDLKETEAQKTGGTLTPPISRRTGQLPAMSQDSTASPLSKGILSFAHKQIGQPYVWGGESRSEGGFDCSGLIQAAYAAHGIKIPRVTYDQIKGGKPVEWGNFKAGDLIFSNNGGHVTMYVGGGKVIAAPHKGAVVRYQDVTDFQDSFVTARRYLD